MQIFLINLDRATDRLAFQKDQFARLGLSFERLPAVEKSALPTHIPEHYWNQWERPLLAAERACILSHKSCWQRVATSGEPALILEDDAILSRDLPAILAAARTTSFVDHLSLETRGRRKFLSRSGHPLTSHTALHRLYQDRTGAAAYILWPTGAEKLLQATRTKAAIADAQICRTHSLASWQTVPAAAVQADMGPTYAFQPPIGVKSSIAVGQIFVSDDKGNLGHRFRRLSGQLHLGWRQMSLQFAADRTFVPFDADDFPVLSDPAHHQPVRSR